MKYNTFAVIILSVAAFAVGCEKEPTASQQIDRLKTETKEAAQDMKDYTFALKAEFTEKMNRDLVEINKGLDQLEAKIEKSSEAVKAEAKPKLKALRDQEAQLKKHLEEARNATESGWDNVKSGTKKAYDGLKEGFQQ